MIAIVVSRADAASEYVGEHLLDLADWTAREDDSRPDGEGGGRYYRTDGFELREFDALHLELERPADAFADPDLVVFASRHSGETGPLLTAHFTGNFGPAEYGGEDGRLARACPAAHARLLSAFEERAPDGYDVGTECTHHGPSDVGAPSLFAELGSGEEQWEDPDGARAVARSILALRGVAPDADRRLVGFGGGHYAPRFTRIVRETEWAVGHVAADWCLDAMGAPAENRDLVRQAFERSDAAFAVTDGERPELEGVIEDLGYRVVSETWAREVQDVSLPVADELEDSLTPVDDGLRFGAPAADHRGGFEIVDLPDELVADAQGVDADRTRDVVAERALAFETTESGNRIGGRAAVAAPEVRERLIDDLADVLADGYDAVERTPDAVVARETAFDPELARERGVPEGPKFGRLSNGQSVTVDGETVDPAAVRTERTREFPV